MNYIISDNNLIFDCGCSIPVKNNQIEFCPDSHSKNFNVNLNCPETYKSLSEGLTEGIFQLCSNLGRSYCTKLKPDSLKEVAALGSILRPSCLDAKDEAGVSLTTHYVRRKNHEEDIPQFNPTIDNLLKETYGTLIFQESALAIVKECACFTLSEADSLRKSLGKKSVTEMAKNRKKFLEKTKEVGILNEEESIKVFDWIEAGQRYSFNKCLAGDTGVYVKGIVGLVSIDQIKINDYILAPDDTYKETEWVKVKNVYNNGVKDLYEVRFNNFSIKCTLDHKFLCDDYKKRSIRNILGKHSVKTIGSDEKITSIIYLGKDKTYDLEVDNKHHLYYANQLAVSNSHAFCYSLNSYITAFIKTHFPVQFYKNWLANEKDREEYPKLINEAKIFNINVNVPDIRHLKSEFYYIKKNIYFGLGNIKGMIKGDISRVADLLSEKGWLASDLGHSVKWIDFLYCILSKLSSRTAEGLIKSGSLDCFSLDRSILYSEYEKFLELTPSELKLYEGGSLLEFLQTISSYYRVTFEKKEQAYRDKTLARAGSTRKYKTELEVPTENKRAVKIAKLVGLLREPIYNIQDTVDSLCFAEEEFLGASITKHASDSIKVCAETHSCLDIVNGYKGHAVLRVKIEKANPYKVKNGASAGRYMCFVGFSDNTYNMDNAVMFANEYEESKHLLTEGNLVYISGNMDKESFIIKRVYSLQ